MNELLTLVRREYEDDGYTVKAESRREVFCRVASVGQQEFYAAYGTDLKPEYKFILADYYDYEQEFLCIYNGEWFRVVRTYRQGQELEIVVQRAAAEEVGDDGENH